MLHRESFIATFMLPQYLFTYTLIMQARTGWILTTMRARWRFLGPPAEHVTFLPSQLPPDTDVWLVVLLPEKGDAVEELRESAHTPSCRWHWQLWSMCWVWPEQEMAFSCSHCFWWVNDSSSLPREICCPGWGWSAGHHLTKVARPKSKANQNNVKYQI